MSDQDQAAETQAGSVHEHGGELQYTVTITMREYERGISMQMKTEPPLETNERGTVDWDKTPDSVKLGNLMHLLYEIAGVLGCDATNMMLSRVGVATGVIGEGDKRLAPAPQRNESNGE